jgi:hypothetical protein
MATAPEPIQKVFDYIDKNVEKTLPFPKIKPPHKYISVIFY